MAKRIIFYLLLIFIVADIGYSFVQHLQTVLDGDMAECILPSNEYKKIFQDPLGISVITQNASYPNPNRFFCYFMFSNYFKSIPFILQNFVSPIDSVYLASAIAKILIQVSILFLLGFYITGRRTVFKEDFLIAIALITPLFQTNGYHSYMGIIDLSITYTFSYALPCLWLLIFYLPFYDSSFFDKKVTSKKVILTLLIVFTLFITLNGPLNPGVILVISLLYLWHQFKLNFSLSSDTSIIRKIVNALDKIPKAHLFFFSLACILSLYSLYIGNSSSLFLSIRIPVLHRYLRLPEGLYYLLSQKIGYPLLLIMIGINAFLIHRNYKTIEGIKILKMLKWIGLFSFLYILLLPLGGYRTYRPDLIRYDSIMPISLALFFIYGLSTCFLVKNLSNNKRKIFLLCIICFSFIFTFADKLELGKNNCEKQSLTQLSNSKEDTVILNNNCTVMSWKKITDPTQSELNAELLQYWGITKEKKLYYQK